MVANWYRYRAGSRGDRKHARAFNDSGRAQGDRTKVTERAQNADVCRKPKIFADSPLNSWKFKHFEGAGISQKTADFFSQKTEDFRRKPQETADWAPSP